MPWRACGLLHHQRRGYLEQGINNQKNLPFHCAITQWTSQHWRLPRKFYLTAPQLLSRNYRLQAIMLPTKRSLTPDWLPFHRCQEKEKRIISPSWMLDEKTWNKETSTDITMESHIHWLTIFSKLNKWRYFLERNSINKPWFAILRFHLQEQHGFLTIQDVQRCLAVH